MKIKKVNELYLSDYTEEELNKFRNERFKPESQYTLYGELLEKNLHTKPEYIRLFDSDDLESCINWYEEYLEDVKDMNFLELKRIFKVSGFAIRIIKYHNIILHEYQSKILNIDMIMTTRKYNV